MTAAARKLGKARFLDLFLVLFSTGALIGFGLMFLCIFILIWLHGGVTLVEPNRIILAYEMGLSLVLVALGLILSRRLRKLLKWR